MLEIIRFHFLEKCAIDIYDISIVHFHMRWSHAYWSFLYLKMWINIWEMWKNASYTTVHGCEHELLLKVTAIITIWQCRIATSELHISLILLKLMLLWDSRFKHSRISWFVINEAVNSKHNFIFSVNER